MNHYAEYRTKIKSGDLLAWTHRGWKSWHDIKIQMVRMFTQSEYSHVGTAWVVGGRVFVIEAVEPMVRIFPLSQLGDFYHNPMNLNWTEQVEEHAISKVGSEYKQLHAVKAFFKELSPGDVSECAALYLNVAYVAGVDLGLRATPDAVVRAAQMLGSPTYYVKN